MMHSKIKMKSVKDAKAYIEPLLKGDFSGLHYSTNGLCDNLYECTGVELIATTFKHYKRFSGSYAFPLLDPLKPCKHGVLTYGYHEKRDTMWTGSEYAKERILFCQWVYDNITVDWIRL